MGESNPRLTPEIFRARPKETEVFREIVADRAISYGLKSKIVYKVIQDLPADVFLEIYYSKTKERFLARFAPLYYQAAGEPQIGPLFEGTDPQNEGPLFLPPRHRRAKDSE